MCGVWGYLDDNFTGKKLFSCLSTSMVFEVILMATLPGKSRSPGCPHVWCLRLSWLQLYRERAVFLALHMCGILGYLDGNFTRKELFCWLSTCVMCLRIARWQLYRERAVLLALHMSGVWGYLDGNLTRKNCSPGSPHVWCLRLYWCNFTGKKLFSWRFTCMVFEVILIATLPGKSCSPGSPHVWCLRLFSWQHYRERAVLLALHMCGVCGYLDGNFTGKELFAWLTTCVVFEVILIATFPGKSCSPGSPHEWCLRLSWWQLYREKAVLLALHMCGVWGYFDGNFTGKELFSWLPTCVVFEVILMATIPGKSCSPGAPRVVFEAILMATLPGKSCFPGSPHVWCLRLS